MNLFFSVPAEGSTTMVTVAISPTAIVPTLHVNPVQLPWLALLETSVALPCVNSLVTTTLVASWMLLLFVTVVV